MQIMNNYFRARASMVYMMTNNEVMNQIIAFSKDMNGLLTFMASYPTYGKGTGTKEVSTALLERWNRSFCQSQGSFNFVPVMVVSFLQLM